MASNLTKILIFSGILTATNVSITFNQLKDNGYSKRYIEENLNFPLYVISKPGIELGCFLNNPKNYIEMIKEKLENKLR